MDKNEITRRISLALTNLPGVYLVYLFGSQVDGSTGLLSDVDLGVLIEGDGSIAQMQAHLAHKFNKAMQPLRVDVIMLNSAPIELAYAIISQGNCIHQRDSLTRVEFEAEVLSRYGDYLPVLRAQRRAILEECGDENRVQRYREALGRTQRALSQITAAQR